METTPQKRLAAYLLDSLQLATGAVLVKFAEDGDVDWTSDVQSPTSKAIKSALDVVVGEDIHLSTVDASNISEVVFGLSDGSSFNSSFAHVHSNYNDYKYWKLFTDGTLSKDVFSEDAVDFVGGNNISLTYADGVITIDNSSPVTTDYINAAAFDTGNGVLTLTGIGNAGAIADLDGRYLLISDLPPQTYLHEDLTDITPNQHHDQVHKLTGSDHTESGLTIGHILTAISATGFEFQEAPEEYASWVISGNTGTGNVESGNTVTFIGEDPIVTELQGLGLYDLIITHSTLPGHKHIPGGGSLNQYLKWVSEGDAQWENLPVHEDKYLSAVDASDLASVLFTIENGINITEDFSHTHNYDDYNRWILKGSPLTEYPIQSQDTVEFIGSGGTLIVITETGTTKTVTINSSDADSIDYINAGVFNILDGDVSLTGIGNAGAVFNMDGRYLNLSGGTMTGDINMAQNFLYGVITPINPDDAVNKAYVDGLIDAIPPQTYLHEDLTDITSDQHHSQVHELVGSNHTASGLTVGHVLTSLSATTFAFQALPAYPTVSDAEITITAADGLVIGGSFTLNQAADKTIMIELGTPSSLNASTTNAVSGESHTHAITNSALTSETTEQLTIAGKGRVLGEPATITIRTAPVTKEEEALATGTQIWKFVDGLIGAIDQSKWIEDSGNLYPKTLTNNVGIGTNAPIYMLDVAGTGRFTGLVKGIAAVNADEFVIKSQLDEGIEDGNSYLISVDASNISEVIFGLSDDSSFNSSFAHVHPDYATMNWVGSNFDDYQYWTVSVDGDNPEDILSNAVLDFESGDNVTLTKSAGKILIASSHTDSIDYINAAVFNTGDGVLTLTGIGNAGATVDLDGRYLQLSGGTMAGDINMAQNFLYGIITPTNPDDAVNKAYVDGLIDAVPPQTYLHEDLIDVTPDQHHAQLHAISHAVGNTDELSHDSLLMPTDNPHEKMNWVGPWIGGPNVKDDVTRDGAWTMICINDTTDRPAPQPYGDEVDSINEDVVFETRSEVDVIIRIVKEFEILESGWGAGVWLKLPYVGPETDIKMAIVDVATGIVEMILVPDLMSGEWVQVMFINDPKLAGTVQRIIVEYYNKSLAGIISEFTGRWVLLEGAGQPSGSVMNIDSLTNPTSMRFSWVDQNSIDQEASLRAVEVGQILDLEEQGDSSRTINLEITNIDITDPRFIHFDVKLLSDGIAPIRAGYSYYASFEHGVSDTEYYVAPDYYVGNQPSWTNINTKLLFNGIEQPVSINDGYGIRAVFQPAYVSPDFQLVAYSDISDFIPIVNDARITVLAGNGIIDGGDFTLNQPTDKEIKIVLGTPDTLTSTTANETTTASHTHSITNYELTSDTIDQLTIAGEGKVLGAAAAISIKTAAVADGETSLATGDQIYDFVVGLTEAIDQSKWIESSGKLYPKILTNNVGIGTSIPEYQLDVTGTGRFTGLVKGIAAVNSDEFVIKSQLDVSIEDGNSYLISVDASNISEVVFGVKDKDDVVSSFAHTHTEYLPREDSLWMLDGTNVMLADTTHDLYLREEERIYFYNNEGTSSIYSGPAGMYVTGIGWYFEPTILFENSIVLRGNNPNIYETLNTFGTYENGVDWVRDDQVVSAKAIKALADGDALWEEDLAESPIRVQLISDSQRDLFIKSGQRLLFSSGSFDSALYGDIATGHMRFTGKQWDFTSGAYINELFMLNMLGQPLGKITTIGNDSAGIDWANDEQLVSAKAINSVVSGITPSQWQDHANGIYYDAVGKNVGIGRLPLTNKKLAIEGGLEIGILNFEGSTDNIYGFSATEAGANWISDAEIVSSKAIDDRIKIGGHTRSIRLISSSTTQLATDDVVMASGTTGSTYSLLPPSDLYRGLVVTIKNASGGTSYINGHIDGSSSVSKLLTTLKAMTLICAQPSETFSWYILSDY